MKLYEKKKLSGMSLYTGFFVACFLCALCTLAGCGRKEQLFAELRQEGTSIGNEAAKAESTKAGQEGFDAAQHTEQGIGGEPGQNAKQGQNDPNGQNVKQAVDGETVENPAKEKSIYVHVCGAVKSPGVYELPEGSRFCDAVEMAGGFAEEAMRDYLNMAAFLADGSRLEIPTKEEIERRKKAEKDSPKPAKNDEDAYSYYTVSGKAAADAESGQSSRIASDGLVNINTADASELCALPGIGEGRAKAIIEYREKQGGFRKKEDIMQVSGIGEKMYARMEAYLTIE